MMHCPLSETDLMSVRNDVLRIVSTSAFRLLVIFILTNFIVIFETYSKDRDKTWDPFNRYYLTGAGSSMKSR